MKQVQIAFVGSINAGKTSLIKKYLSNHFQQNSTKPTLWMEFNSTLLQIGTQKYQCNFIDTQGFDNNIGITLIPLYKHYSGFIVVYDVTQPASFQNSKRCFEQIMQNCKVENQNIAFIGNKIDLPRQVPYEQVNEYCLEKNIYQVETSAKNSSQISKIIERIAINLICSNRVKLKQEDGKREEKKGAISINRKSLQKLKEQNCLKKMVNGVRRWLFD